MLIKSLVAYLPVHPNLMVTDMLSSRSIQYSLLLACALLVTPYAGVQAQSFTDVAVGKSHVCGLADTGEVDCFTDAATTRYDAPDGLPSLKALAAGQQHTCGITLDGEAVCWGGLNFFQEQNVPAIDKPLVSMSAGVHHTCAIDETNRVWCWGLNRNEQTQVPGDGYGENGLGFVKVDANETTSCGIQLDGSISCWSTNPLLSATDSLSGTFIDLDLSDYGGCGLKDTGNIQCWYSAFEPPSDGPYTDLVVSLSAICALNQQRSLDCTFNPDISSTDTSLYSTSALFVSLDSYDYLGNTPVFNVCGVTVDATIECLASSELAGVPGTGAFPIETVFDKKIDLTAIVYSATALELFWTPIDGVFPPTLVEIYRNDELVDTVTAQFSWFDNSFEYENGEPVNYRIRQANGFSSVGPYSNTITVDVNQGTVTGDNSLDVNTVPEPLNLIGKITLWKFSNLAFISWEGSLAEENGVRGYEIKVNNQTLSLTDSNLFLYQDFDLNECFVFTVSAISDDNTILDFRSIAHAPNDGETQCSLRALAIG